MFNKKISTLFDTNFNKKKIIWGAIIVITAFLILLLTNLILNNSASTNNLANWADQDKYQAVFLTNKQVFFGKLTTVTKEVMILKNVYYFPLAEGDEKNIIKKDNKKELFLLKLKDEVHSPEDEITINREHVLFVENLSNNSEVAKALHLSK